MEQAFDILEENHLNEMEVINQEVKKQLSKEIN